MSFYPSQIPQNTQRKTGENTRNTKEIPWLEEENQNTKERKIRGKHYFLMHFGSQFALTKKQFLKHDLPVHGIPLWPNFYYVINLKPILTLPALQRKLL